MMMTMKKIQKIMMIMMTKTQVKFRQHQLLECGLYVLIGFIEFLVNRMSLF